MTTETTQAPTPAAEPRLTFRAWKPFHSADPFAAYVEVTERLSKKRSVAFTYAVLEATPPGVPYRAFHFFKEGQAEPRELRVYPDGHACTCPSGAYRPGRSCRHRAAIDHLTSVGVI